MTRNMNARLAGIAYLLYIAVALPAMMISRRATAGSDMATRLTTMAQHAFDVRLAAVLSLIGCFCALTLAATLYAVTRTQDRDLSMLALTCRVAEGITGATGIAGTLALLSMVTATGPNAVDGASLRTLAAFHFSDTVYVSATFFAVGSTIFSWLLLRGRMVPTWLAWIGVVGSAIIVLVLPLQMLDMVSGVIAQASWAPVAVFEIVVALWFIIKGVREPEVSRVD